MKKIIFMICFVLTLFYSSLVYGADMNETIKTQEEALGISDFIKEAGSYTKDTFSNMDVSSIYKDAISGKIEINGISKGILKIAGKEVSNTIRILGYILIIIIVHGIIKNISEGMGNNEIGEITYYVQYILIVTLIMSNFSDVVVLIKDTVNNLVGFLNSLLPILLALMVATRKYHNCIYCSTCTSCYNYFYRKYNIFCFFTTYTNWYITWNNIKDIR